MPMPNRIIKGTVCTSDDVNQLSWFEEVLFYRLIVSCDDFGRFDGRPAIIKSTLFPLKVKVSQGEIQRGINRLASIGLITLYEVDGKPYLYLTKWTDHQRVRNSREKYPSPDISDNSPQLAASCSNSPQVAARARARAGAPASSDSDSDKDLDSGRKRENRGLGEGEEKEPGRKPRKTPASQPDAVQWAENVTMTNAEHDKLLATYGPVDTARLIEILDNYKGANGKKYRSDYRAILSWCTNRLEEEKAKAKKADKVKTAHQSWTEIAEEMEAEAEAKR